MNASLPPARVHHADEVSGARVGLDPARLHAVWRAVQALHHTGLHPAVVLAIRHRGALVINRSIGCLGPASDAHDAPLTPDTPLCLFSASKAISALLLHKLVDDGQVSLDDRVAAFLPAFAAHGKHRVSLRDLLAHRAGIPTFALHPQEGPKLLYDWDEMLRRLCDAPPFDPRFHTQAYHALTAGFVLGEVIRRVSGMDLRDCLRQWIAEPLGLQRTTYGLPAEWRTRFAPNTVTGWRPVWPLTHYIRSIIGMDFVEGVQASNGPAFLDTVVPAGNIFSTAEETGRIYQMLLDGGTWQGRRVFKRETIDAAIAPYGAIQFDRTIRLPLRFSAGFMLGERPVGLFGPDAPRAFGHLGFTSVLTWADPERALSAALLNSGKSLSARGMARLYGVLAAISRAFPKA